MMETYASYVGHKKDMVGYNGKIYSWEAFKLLCPLTVSSLSITDFYLNSPAAFSKFLNRVAFMMENIKIEPGHTVQGDFYNNRPGAMDNGEKFPNAVRGPWETGEDEPQIDVKDREIREAIRKNTQGWQSSRSILPVIIVPRPSVPEFVASEERWNCPSCNMEWPENAVEQSWRDNNNCAGCV